MLIMPFYSYTLAISLFAANAFSTSIFRPSKIVHIHSNPQGAEIWIDGKATGEITPAGVSLEYFDVQWKSGKMVVVDGRIHNKSLVLKKKEFKSTQPLKLTADTADKIEITLERM